MATLEYRFTQSAPVLRHLARTRRQSPPSPLLRTSSEHTEKVKPFEFIDSSLSLLGDLQRTQDDHIRQEFEQQRDFITSQFRQESYENGQRDSAVDQRFIRIREQLGGVQGQLESFKEEVGQRFEEVGQRFDAVEAELNGFRQEVGQRFDVVGQRFDEMHAMTFNSLSYRAGDRIHPVAVFIGNRLQNPDEDYFPATIQKFWKLHSRSPTKAYDRFRLLQFYSIEGYQRWNRESEFSIESGESDDSDESDSSLRSLTLEEAARSYPSKCVEALAARLGLNYDKIDAHVKQLQERRQQSTAQPLKRPQADVISSNDGGISKRTHRLPASSTTSGLQRKQSGNRAALKVPEGEERFAPKEPGKTTKRQHMDIVSSKHSEGSKRSHQSPSPPTNSKPQLEDDSPRSSQLRHSQGGTDVVPETVLLETQQPSQGSTEVFSFEKTQPTVEGKNG